MQVAALRSYNSARPLQPGTSNYQSGTSGVAGEAAGAAGALVPTSVLVAQVAGLVWAHSCIGFGFFILQVRRLPPSVPIVEFLWYRRDLDVCEPHWKYSP